jgi:hypothetical protein
MLRIPQQSQPVARTNPTSYQAQGEVRPQLCYCIDPDPPGLGYTWWCEVGRELWNTEINCSGLR